MAYMATNRSLAEFTDPALKEVQKPASGLRRLAGNIMTRIQHSGEVRALHRIEAQYGHLVPKAHVERMRVDIAKRYHRS